MDIETLFCPMAVGFFPSFVAPVTELSGSWGENPLQ